MVITADYEVKDFKLDVLDASQDIPVLVDYWAEWCGPCKFLGPIVEKLAAEAKGKWKLVKVNTEIHQDLAAEWGIRGIPNLKLFYKGEVIEEVSGAMPEPDMRRWLHEKLPSKAKTLCLEAQRLIKEGLKEEAVPMLEEALLRDPANQDALIMLAKLKLWQNPGEVVDMLDDLQYLEKVNEILLLAKALDYDTGALTEDRSRDVLIDGLEALKKHNIDEALEALIRAVMLNKLYQNELARRLVIAIFHFMGESHEITKKYRRRFDMVLY
jgi:putative thioredoxin